MRRRGFLACVGGVCLTGCTSSSLPFTGGDNGPYGGLKIVDVLADKWRDGDGGYPPLIHFEHVTIENQWSDPIPLDGLVLRYDEDHEYAMPSFELESGATLYVMSKQTRGSNLESLPPKYVRGADFENPTTVLESPGTVTLQDPDGERIFRHQY